MATTAQFHATFDKNHPNVLDDPNLLLVGVVASKFYSCTSLLNGLQVSDLSKTFLSHATLLIQCA
jgi:hypothetical protein